MALDIEALSGTDLTDFQTVVRNAVGKPVWKGATLSKNSAQSIASAFTAVSWSSALRDTNGFWSSGAATRLTIPAGVSKVRLTAGIVFTGGVDTDVQIWRNGASANGVLGLPRWAFNPFKAGTLTSAAIDVVAGDYFELVAWRGSSSPLDLGNAFHNFFEIQVLEGSVLNFA